MKVTEVPQISTFYHRLAEMVVKNGDLVLKSGELVNQQLANWFKYGRQEAKSFRESDSLFKDCTRKYEEMQTSVTKQKEKIYK
jgi:formylmethanofuran dehydrogenase subunit A